MAIDNPGNQNGVDFYIARSLAIDAYSGVERSLSSLLAYLLGTPIDLAAIVFFRIANASSRNAIIADLLQKKFGTTYEAYWNGIPNTHNRRGLFTWLRQLDTDRNKIVHWAMVNNMNIGGDSVQSRLSLRKPDFWASISEAEVTLDDLTAFYLKADFVKRSLNMFGAFISEHRHLMPSTWQEIFQQPCLYPPPDTHPLSLNYRAHESQPPPSQA